MEVTEEPPKPPSKSEIRSAINTLSLHSEFVDQDCVEKITKHTRQLSLTAYFLESPSDVNALIVNSYCL